MMNYIYETVCGHGVILEMLDPVHHDTGDTGERKRKGKVTKRKREGKVSKLKPIEKRVYTAFVNAMKQGLWPPLRLVGNQGGGRSDQRRIWP
jgi:hypothetical protein